MSAAKNADQLRSMIDSGGAQDKIDFPDPAIAPLGSDSEAGGAPASTREIALAFQEEARGDNRPKYPVAVILYVAFIATLVLLAYAMLS